ncbi:glutaredoxin family protein [Natronospirillum operosum]|uniref:Glutaredoxin family protein n=1 Tax=Natronospirillum operosum TaxID=2759953 RepID=A0A4Z0WCX9_9GAMM|nr:glutaredoxin family protein [Natronospirillum operosum]TGG95714.1 glutaredoxin family protein [Natronospirillum operosum]
MPIELTLYGTSHCHLCEQAEAVLLPFVAASQCQVELIDIAEDESLLTLYGTRIPVLRHGPTGITLDWPFDSSAVARLLQE